MRKAAINVIPFPDLNPITFLHFQCIFSWTVLKEKCLSHRLSFAPSSRNDKESHVLSVTRDGFGKAANWQYKHTPPRLADGVKGASRRAGFR